MNPKASEGESTNEQQLVFLHVYLLLIDRHKQEVFGENVNMAGPRPHTLMPHVAIPESKVRRAGDKTRQDANATFSEFTERRTFINLNVYLFLRDGGGSIFSGDSSSAQLFEEEAAEDVAPLGHGAAHSLQEQEPAGGSTTPTGDERNYNNINVTSCETDLR